MHRCNECGHHHGQGEAWLPCQGFTYNDDGGIARCNCHHTNHENKDAT